MTARPRSLSISAVVAVIFGLLSVASGGNTLFGGANMGQIVPFVLWFNFFAGFAYLLAGIGLWRVDTWAPQLALVIAVTTAVVFVAFLWHIWRGGAWEMRTMGAMVLRTVVWAIIATLALRHKNVA